MVNFLKSNIFESIVILLLFIICGFIVLPFEGEWSTMISEQAVQVMFGFLALAMIMFSLDRKKIMFASFICCGVLCLFLKQASNQDLQFPDRNNKPSFSLAHINLSSLQGEYDALLQLLNEHRPDAISFVELTPDWDQFLTKTIVEKFPFVNKKVRIDPYGIALYSSYPISDRNIFFFDDIPNLSNKIHIENQSIHILSSYLLPSMNIQTTNRSYEQLKVIEQEISKIQGPVLSAGDFNMVYWSEKIKRFRLNAQLLNSRRNISVADLQVPYDHIFYSDQLECIEFIELESEDRTHIGIIGQYQFQ